MADGKNSLVLRKKEESKWDLVSLGEVMLRLDPGDVRVATTRSSRCGGRRRVQRGARAAAMLRDEDGVVTALADNPWAG